MPFVPTKARVGYRASPLTVSVSTRGISNHRNPPAKSSFLQGQLTFMEVMQAATHQAMVQFWGCGFRGLGCRIYGPTSDKAVISLI